MLDKLKSFFTKAPEAETPKQTLPPRPTTPLEILTPEDRPPPEPPKFAGKFISYLVASANDVNVVSIESAAGHIHSTDNELLQFLTWVAGANHLDALLSQCRSIMFPSSVQGAVGALSCIQQPHFHSFAVIESSHLPNLSWELRRQTRVIQPGAGAPAASY